jgi:Cu-processing system permease protein
MNPIVIIAGKEIADGLRNRWILAATLILGLLALTIALLGSAPTGTLGVAPLAVTVASLASLSIFLIPLIALLLSYDSIVGEAERGTLLLLLTYPVTRSQILFGKLLGHCGILAIATLAGYGGAGLAVGLTQGSDPESWSAFAVLIATSILLGGAFVAMATLTSLLARERGMAAGVAVALWLFLVVLFDLALLGLLVTADRVVPPKLFGWLLLLDPADIFRLINLSGFANIRKLSGMAAIGEGTGLSQIMLMAALLAWIAVPAAASVFILRRREA